jgi:hypothetical protein
VYDESPATDSSTKRTELTVNTTEIFSRAVAKICFVVQR